MNLHITIQRKMKKKTKNIEISNELPTKDIHEQVEKVLALLGETFDMNEISIPIAIMAMSDLIASIFLASGSANMYEEYLNACKTKIKLVESLEQKENL